MSRSGPPRLARAVLRDSLLVALALWIYHVGLSHWMQTTGATMGILPPGWLVPVHARVQLDLSLWLVPALVVVGGLLLMSRRLFSESVPVACMLGAALVFFVLIASSVAMIDGFPDYAGERYPALVLPYVRTHLEYLGDVPHVDRLGGPSAFLAKYPQPRFFTTLSMHAQTHPPGGVLFLWLVGRLFGPGMWPAAFATVAFSALCVLPTYLLGRELYGERVARAALLLLLLMPNVVMYAATSMDGPFTVFGLVALQLSQRALRAGSSLAWAGLWGLALASASFMTYAVVLLPVLCALQMCLAAASGERSRMWAMLRVHAVGLASFVGAYGLLFWGTGYDPLAAVRAAIRHDEAMMGTGHETVGRWFNLGCANLVAYSFGVGLPLLVAWARQWPVVVRRSARASAPDHFVVAAGATILLAAFSTLFTLEVERVWLFTAPFVLLPAARQIVEPGDREGGHDTLLWVAGLLALQLLVAEAVLRTPW